VLDGVQYYLTTRGIQRGELKADTAYVLDDQNRFDLRKAHVVFTTETGAPQGTMDGNRGMYNLRTQILEGWGDVVVKLVDGRTLKSPHITYNQLTHQISSDTSFVASRGSDNTSGIGFTSDQAFASFTCLRACGGNSSVLLPEK
jgi:LPS export ABC transporter protein LptC